MTGTVTLSLRQENLDQVSGGHTPGVDVEHVITKVKNEVTKEVLVGAVWSSAEGRNGTCPSLK